MFFRWMFGLPAAALVTALLFLAMQALIARDVEAGEMKKNVEISIFAKIDPTRPVKTTPIRPRKVEPPPPVDSLPTEKQGRPGDDGFRLPNLLPENHNPEKLYIPRPTIRVTPAYPDSCRSRGVEGVVIVRFDVTAEGEPTNIVVVSTPNACFNQTVIRTVSKWKYSPRVVDNRPVPQRGVTEVFNFTLTD